MRLEPLEDRRLLAAGMLDPTFGVGGLVSTEFEHGLPVNVADAAIQPDGKIVVAGNASLFNGAYEQPFLARYNADGTLDDGSASDSTPGDFFGSTVPGHIRLDGLAGTVRITAVALQADGRIVVAGTQTTGLGQRSFLVARLNTNGSLDNGFYDDGYQIFDFGGGLTEARDVVVQPDGKIVVAGTAQFDDSPTQTTFALARLNTDGSLEGGPLDLTPGDDFGPEGKRLVSFDSLPGVHTVTLTDIALQADGSIVAVGQADDGTGRTVFALAHLIADGSAAVNFGANGVLIHDLTPGDDSATSVALQSDGKIVAGGFINNQRAFILSRYLPNGDVDNSFGTSGVALTDIVPDGEALFDLLVQGDGRIVAAGMARDRFAESFGDFALVRYDSTGQLDPTFGAPDPADPSRRTGIVVTDFGAQRLGFIHDEAHAVILTPQGLVVAGTTRFHVNDILHSGAALARYEAGDNGPAILRPTEGGARSFGFSLAADGNVLVVGDPEFQSHVINLGTATVGRASSFDLVSGVQLADLHRSPPTFDPSDLEPYESPLYGLSVAVIGGTAAVGVPGSGYVDFRDAYTGASLGYSTLGFDAGKLTDYGTALAAVDRDVVLGPDGFVIGAPERLSDPLPDQQYGHVEYVDLDPVGAPHTANSIWDFRWVHPQTTGGFPLPPEEEMGDYYGEAVAGLPGKVLVGDSLAARAYLQSASDGALLRTLAPPSDGPGAYFGSAVAGYGADVLVGAPGDGGAVYLYDGSTGDLVRTFVNPFPDAQDLFGFSILSLGNYVLIGAPNDDTLGVNAGAVYIFDGLTGDLVRTVVGPEPGEFANFGFALCAIGENAFAVGAPSLLSISDQGAVYLLDLGLPVGPPRSGATFPGVIQGTVWEDSDGDGLDGGLGEPGVPGQVVFLDLNGNGRRDPLEHSVTTGNAGEYELRLREPGTYTVSLELPVGVEPTLPEGVPSTGYRVSTSVELGAAYAYPSTAADFNRDGLPDLAFTTPEFGDHANHVRIFINDPSGPTELRHFSDVPIGHQVSELVAADINGDGLLDLVVALRFEQATGAVAILLNNPAAPGTFTLDGFAGLGEGSVFGLVAGDFNNDGRTDIAFTGGIVGSSSSLQVLLQDPDGPGRFLDPVVYNNLPASLFHLASADFNRDGLADLVVTHLRDPGSGFSVLFNSTASPGTFEPSDPYLTPSTPQGMAIADLDGDGLVEVIIGRYQSTINIYVNDPAAPGSFVVGEGYILPNGLHPQYLKTADMNGDGRPDLLYRSDLSGIGVLLNNPAVPRTLLPSAELLPGQSNNYILADFDRDGRSDVVSTTGYTSGNGIFVALARRARQVSHTITLSAAAPTAIGNFGRRADFDADGTNDRDESDRDFNLDGVPDRRQANVVSLDGNGVGLVAPAGMRLLNVSITPAPPDGDPGAPPVELPEGLIAFTLEGLDVGAAVDVTLHFFPVITADSYFKFGPTPADPTPHWYNFLSDDALGDVGATLFDDNGNGFVDRIRLRLRDGGLGDHDGIANGVIVDPGGPAIVVPPPIYVAGVDAGAAPQVRVFDAATGAEKFSFLAYRPDFMGGVRVATGDLNGDGAADIITGAGRGDGPQVRVFDGVTGQPFSGALGSFFAFSRNFTGGVFVASADVSGDGRDDIITSAGAGGGPHVRVFSGVDGARIMDFFAYDRAFTRGVLVAAGDINGDGRADVITSPHAGSQPVKVFSGDGGAELRSFFPYGSAFGGGAFVAAGDINADGKEDIITGAGRGGGPQVRVFSGDDGSRLASFFAYDSRFTGGVRVASADVDGDGRDDLITGAGIGGGPQVRTFSGLDFRRLSSSLAYDRFYGGIFVAAGPHGDAANAVLPAPAGDSLSPERVDLFWAAQEVEFPRRRWSSGQLLDSYYAQL